jgi:hypothetical protein
LSLEPIAISVVAKSDIFAHESQSVKLRQARARIRTKGVISMAWLYEIRDSKDRVFKLEGGFPTQEAARAAGKEEANKLKSSGALPGSGLGTVTETQDSKEPTRD